MANLSPRRIALLAGLAATVVLAAASAQAQNALATQDNVRYVNPTAAPENGHYGRYMARGDFDGNGIDDIAVAGDGHGTVRVYRGVAWTVGAGWMFNKFIVEEVAGPPSGPWELAAGDFDNDGRDELAWGAAGASSGGQSGAGAVFVMDRAVNGVWSVQEEIRLGQFGYGGTPGIGDGLGEALAVGDFDGDGFDDLAMGLRGATVAGVLDAGRVLIAYGSGSGIVPAGHQFFDRNTNFVPGVPGEFDLFGASLASADFDNDGFDDLAIAATSATCALSGAGLRGGGVTILNGTGTGLTAIGSQWLAPGQDGLPGICGAGTQFGRALAAGRVSFDLFDDLVIGAPGGNGGGAVVAVFGQAGGLDPADATLVRAVDMPGPVSGTAQFGAAVAIGALRSAPFQAASLAIGAPLDTVDGVEDAGSVWVVHGAANRPSPATAQRWTANSGLAIGPAQDNDRFGAALAIGDFNDDATPDLAIGAFLDSEAGSNAGAFQVIYQSGFIFRDGFE